MDGRVHPARVLHGQPAQAENSFEEVFGWMKTVGASRKLLYVGVAKNQFRMTMEAITHNLVRMANLEPSPG